MASSSSSSSSPLRVPGPLVSVGWLRAHYPRVRVIDGSWYMPAEKQDAKANFIAARLPGARFFDLDACSSKEGSNADLPHMLPSAAQFAAYLRSVDLDPSSAQGPEQAIVIYDGKGLFSAPRVRFTFQHFGLENVAILEGGIKAWKAEGGEVESGEPKPAADASSSASDSSAAASGLSTASDVIEPMSSVQSNVASGNASFTLVDARSAGRFQGTEPEPRADISSGHILGAKNVPFTSVLKTDDKSGASVLRPVEELESVFRSAGVDPHTPQRLVASCGSGVTACVVLLALENCGRNLKQNTGLYDGSWTEWVLRGNKIEKVAKA